MSLVGISKLIQFRQKRFLIPSLVPIFIVLGAISWLVSAVFALSFQDPKSPSYPAIVSLSVFTVLHNIFSLYGFWILHPLWALTWHEFDHRRAYNVLFSIATIALIIFWDTMLCTTPISTTFKQSPFFVSMIVLSEVSSFISLALMIICWWKIRRRKANGTFSEQKTASDSLDAPSVLPTDSRLVDRSILDTDVESEGADFSGETINAFGIGSPRSPSLASDREAPNEGLVIHRPKSVMDPEPNNALLPKPLYPNLSIHTDGRGSIPGSDSGSRYLSIYTDESGSIPGSGSESRYLSVYTDESGSIPGSDSKSRYSITSWGSRSQSKRTYEMASSLTDFGMEGRHQPGLELPTLQNDSDQETQTRTTRMRCDTFESNATYATLPSYRSKASGSVPGSSLGEIPPPLPRPLPRPLPLVPLASSEAGISQMAASTSTHSHDIPSGYTWPFHLPL